MLPSFKHEGPLPPGCALDERTFTFKKGDMSFSITIQIVYGSRTKLLQKTRKALLQINRYLLHASLSDIVASKRFKIIKDLKS